MLTTNATNHATSSTSLNQARPVARHSNPKSTKGNGEVAITK
jgi:hypothetical protein